MSLRRIVSSILLESKASEQAKKLGLVSAGWGRWKDPKTGQVVAKTVGDKLVRVAAPLADPEQQRVAAMGTAVSPAPTAPTKQTPLQARLAKADAENSEEYFNPEFYGARRHDLKSKFVGALQSAPKVKEAVTKAVGSILGVSSKLRYEYDSQWLAQMNMHTGADMVAAYCSTTREVFFTRKATQFLKYFAENAEQIMTDLIVPNPLNKNAQMNSALAIGFGLHPVVHELIHSKDRAMHNEADMKTMTPFAQSSTDFLAEGLTERKAREVTLSLVTDRETRNKAPLKDMFVYYDREVDAIDQLESMSPGIAARLWGMSERERHNTVCSTLYQRFTGHFERLGLHNPVVEKAYNQTWLPGLKQTNSIDVGEAFFALMQNGVTKRLDGFLSTMHTAEDLEANLYELGKIVRGEE